MARYFATVSAYSSPRESKSPSRKSGSIPHSSRYFRPPSTAITQSPGLISIFMGWNSPAHIMMHLPLIIFPAFPVCRSGVTLGSFPRNKGPPCRNDSRQGVFCSCILPLILHFPVSYLSPASTCLLAMIYVQREMSVSASAIHITIFVSSCSWGIFMIIRMIMIIWKVVLNLPQ